MLWSGSGMVQLGWNLPESWAVASGLRARSAMWKTIDLLTEDTLFGAHTPVKQITAAPDYWEPFWFLMWMSMVRPTLQDTSRIVWLIGPDAVSEVKLLVLAIPATYAKFTYNCFMVEAVPFHGSLSLPALGKMTTRITPSIPYLCLYLSRLSITWFWPYNCDPWNLSS